MSSTDILIFCGFKILFPSVVPGVFEKILQWSLAFTMQISYLVCMGFIKQMDISKLSVRAVFKLIKRS